MRSRIKYMKTRKENVFASKPIPAKNGAMYKVVIDMNNRTFKIINIKNNAIVRSTEKCGLKPCKDRLGVCRQARRQALNFGLLLQTDIKL